MYNNVIGYRLIYTRKDSRKIVTVTESFDHKNSK